MERAYYLFLPQSPAASSFYSDDTAPTTGRRYGIRARGSFVHVRGRKPRLVPASSHMPGGSSGGDWPILRGEERGSRPASHDLTAGQVRRTVPSSPWGGMYCRRRSPPGTRQMRHFEANLRAFGRRDPRTAQACSLDAV